MLLAVVSGVVVAATSPSNFGQEPNGPKAEEAGLPSGASPEFHRMVDWAAAPQRVPLRTVNHEDMRISARLDRLAITSRFGWRNDPITGSERRHAGIDLPGRLGSPVMATAPGTVRIAGWAGGYGNLVEIEHAGGVRTRYGHLSRLAVFASEHVEQGQVIGEVGSTGHSTGPHLHFEVRVAGSAVDPLTFVSQRLPTVETIWGNELRAAPRWAWSGIADNKLPEASLR